MSDSIKADSILEFQGNALQDLAAELAVDVEALEERLEMVTFDAVACCVVNVGCGHLHAV